MTLKTHQWLVDEKEQTPKAQPSLGPSEMCTSPVQVTLGEALPKGQEPLLAHEGEGSSRGAGKEPMELDDAHHGWKWACSNNLTTGPTGDPREIVLVLKCKMVTLSLVEPIFEKHKVLFIKFLLP